MTILQIHIAPDPVLKKKAEPVAGGITADLRQLMDDMLETMYATDGIGLAAPQVGQSLQIFVLDLSLGKDPAGLIVMVNPEFVEREGMQLEEEGCLSVPGFTATVATRTMEKRRTLLAGAKQFLEQ